MLHLVGGDLLLARLRYTFNGNCVNQIPIANLKKLTRRFENCFILGICTDPFRNIAADLPRFAFLRIDFAERFANRPSRLDTEQWRCPAFLDCRCRTKISHCQAGPAEGLCLGLKMPSNRCPSQQASPVNASRVFLM